MTSTVADATPSKQAVLRALPGTRHFHICGSILTEPRSFDTATSALSRARSIGASTSLDVTALPPTSDWRAFRSLLTHVHVLFADSGTLRALAEQARIGTAATKTLELGPTAIAIRLGAGGSRVYSRDKTIHSIRIRNLGAEVERAGSAFASGYLLGWLLGSGPEICGVLGSVAALETTKPKLPDRRELASRLDEARKNPLFSKLVPALSEGGRLLDRTRRLPRRDLVPAKSRLAR
jgi:sugar/nucleoside kinase (ribokinase family)